MEHKKIIFQVAVPGPFSTPLDYLAPEDCTLPDNPLGLRVKVPLRKKQVIGVITGEKPESDSTRKKLKSISYALDDAPLHSPTLMKLLQWASDYYHCPLGDVLAASLPAALRKDKTLLYYQNKFLKTPEKNIFTKQEEPLSLNSEQQKALHILLQHTEGFKPFLLYGVTGSGKTEIYLQMIDALLKKQKQILVLVPEIGLTPQTLLHFQERFSVPIAVIHSGLSDNEKLKSWLLAKEGLAPIVIGTRSAIFTPLPKLGMIIVDEEHDLSFKQQDGFRYSARDLSLVRAQFENIPIILGSATPSFESLHNTHLKQYHFLGLHQRAGNASLPSIKLIDLKKQSLTAGLSKTLIDAIKKHLAQKNQVLLFLNRRGYAPSILCPECSFLAKCHRCDARLTYHHTPARLRCHHCHYECKPYTHCPSCQHQNLILLGQGTQKLEETLKTLFPEETLLRIDRDSTRKKNAIKGLLEKVQQGQGNILVGTQMLAKGHHFPNVTLVAILDIDVGLSSNDFRSTERIAQLITQVAGRSGRACNPGEVLIQTHFPEHPIFNILISEGYLSFSKHALNERASAKLPPYHFLAVLRAESKNASYPLAFLNDVATFSKKIKSPINVMGPIAAFMEKRAGYFRAQLAFQAAKRSQLHDFLNKIIPSLDGLTFSKRVRYIIEIDPQEVL
ncbi:MAG: hypothetical protein ACD_44C00321G0004 [uncultured bacterium]|nr:MAG: hypothetical protein ACD_44C00321G0004 [uncultured bacterium]